MRMFSRKNPYHLVVSVINSNVEFTPFAVCTQFSRLYACLFLFPSRVDIKVYILMFCAKITFVLF